MKLSKEILSLQKNNGEVMVAFLTSQLLTKHKVPHGFFTRASGVSSGQFESLNCNPISGDAAGNVNKNFDRATAALGFSGSDLYHLKQIHSNVVHEALDSNNKLQGDAIFTAKTDRLVAVYTADCVPILLYAPDIKAVAAIHAGWRGALSGVIQVAVARFAEMGSDPKNIVAAIGPCIQQANYTFGQDVIDQFIEADAGNAEFFSGVNFNPPAYCHRQLQLAGVEQIEDLAMDTYSNSKDFFSFRRYTHECLRDGVPQKQGAFGSQLSAIALPRVKK